MRKEARGLGAFLKSHQLSQPLGRHSQLTRLALGAYGTKRRSPPPNHSLGGRGPTPALGREGPCAVGREGPQGCSLERGPSTRRQACLVEALCGFGAAGGRGVEPGGWPDEAPGSDRADQSPSHRWPNGNSPKDTAAGSGIGRGPCGLCMGAGGSITAALSGGARPAGVCVVGGCVWRLRVPPSLLPLPSPPPSQGSCRFSSLSHCCGVYLCQSLRANYLCN